MRVCGCHGACVFVRGQDGRGGHPGQLGRRLLVESTDGQLAVHGVVTALRVRRRRVGSSARSGEVVTAVVAAQSAGTSGRVDEAAHDQNGTHGEGGDADGGRATSGRFECDEWSGRDSGRSSSG